MDLPKHVRFARAIALVGAAGAIGCGARTPWYDDLASEQSDAAPDTADASADAIPETAPAGPGTCISYASSETTCAAGGTCVWNSATGYADCRFDVIEAAACGAIRCGNDCECADPREGICRCAGPIAGPLPPPDLPVV